MLFFSAVSFGLVFSPFISSSLIILLLNLLLLFAFWKSPFSKNVLLLKILFFFQCGLLLGSLALPKLPQSPLLEKVKKEEKKIPVWIEGRIISSEITVDGSKAVVETLAYYDCEKKIFDNIRIIAYLPIEPPEPLSTFKGCFFLSLPKTKTNPGQFDYRKSLSQKGIYLSGELKDKALYTTLNENLLSKFLNKYRNILRSQIIEKCGRERGIVLALLLGERGILDEADEFSLIRSGLFHLIALSGLHIGIIILILYFVLNSFKINPFLTDGIVLTFLPIYMLIVKDQPSIIRAAVMALVFITARIAARQSGSFNSLLISFAFLLCFNPLQIYDAGFQLTFLATLGIISLYSSRLSIFKESTFGDYVCKLFWIGLSAQIFTFPVLIYSFQRISPLSFFATPLASLFLFPLLAFGIIFIFGGSLIPLFNDFLLLVIKFMAKCFLLVPLYFSKLSFSSLFFPKPHYLYATIFSLCLILIVFFKDKKKQYLSASILIIFAFSSYFFPDPFNRISKDFLITLDIGQGNCALLHSKEKNYLIDCADTSYHSVPTSRSIIEPFLSTLKIKKIDGMFITHWDKDHCGSLKEIVRDIKTDFVAFAKCPSPPSDIKDFLSERNVGFVSLNRGDKLDLGGVNISIIHPDCKFDNSLSENDLSLVFSISIDDKTILATGDIEKMGQKEIVESETLLNSADILLAPHHGAKNSLFAPFIQKVSPQIALFSAGRNNRFNHPNPAVLDYYKSVNSKIFRTDKDGAILIVFDKDAIRTFKYCESPWEELLYK